MALSAVTDSTYMYMWLIVSYLYARVAALINMSQRTYLHLETRQLSS